MKGTDNFHAVKPFLKVQTFTVPLNKYSFLICNYVKYARKRNCSLHCSLLFTLTLL